MEATNGIAGGADASFTADNRSLPELPIFLEPSAPLVLPMYLSNPDPQVRQGFYITVYLNINGNRYATTLTSASGAPFWIEGATADPSIRHTYEYLADTRAWAIDRVFDPAKVAQPPIPGNRTCSLLTTDEVARLIGTPVRVRAISGNENVCRWHTPDQSSYLDMFIDVTQGADKAREQFENRRRALPRSYQRHPVIELDNIGERAVNIGPFILTYHQEEYVEFSFDTDRDDKQAAQEAFSSLAALAAQRLWK